MQLKSLLVCSVVYATPTTEQIASLYDAIKKEINAVENPTARAYYMDMLTRIKIDGNVIAVRSYAKPGNRTGLAITRLICRCLRQLKLFYHFIICIGGYNRSIIYYAYDPEIKKFRQITIKEIKWSGSEQWAASGQVDPNTIRGKGDKRYIFIEVRYRI